MLHRAIFGSLERFFGVYLEHCGGNFPAWLAPAPGHRAHRQREERRVRPQRGRAPASAKGLRVDADLSSDKLGAKIRNARLLRYPYMLVVGPERGREPTRVGRALARRGRARRA